jgi:hypothetical protein
MNVEARLADLGKSVRECRTRANALAVQQILQMADQLQEAKSLARRRWSHWLRVDARMSRQTALNHLRAAEFLRSVQSTGQFEGLGIEKIYLLSRLSQDQLDRVASGEAGFTAPIAELSEVQFKTEFRNLFPPAKKRSGRQNAFKAVSTKIRKAVKTAEKYREFLDKFSPEEWSRLEEDYRALGEILTPSLESARPKIPPSGS